MQCIVAHEFGLPESVLSYASATPPELGSGAVLVRLRASPINPSDLIPVTDAYRHRTALPFVPGFEGVGMITAVGSGVNPAMIGRHVLQLGSGGNWQSCKVLAADWCVTVPDGIDDAQAATAYVNPLTARLMGRELAPCLGDRIGLTAGASTIGRMLIRLLAAVGARPMAIVRSPASCAALRLVISSVLRSSKAIPQGRPLQGGRIRRKSDPLSKHC